MTLYEKITKCQLNLKALRPGELTAEQRLEAQACYEAYIDLSGRVEKLRNAIIQRVHNLSSPLEATLIPEENTALAPPDKPDNITITKVEAFWPYLCRRWRKWRKK